MLFQWYQRSIFTKNILDFENFYGTTLILRESFKVMLNRDFHTLVSGGMFNVLKSIV